MQSTEVEQVINAAANKSMLIGGIVGFFGWIFSNGVIGVIGAVMATIGSFYIIVKNRKEIEIKKAKAKHEIALIDEKLRLMQEASKRAEELHRLKVDHIKSGRSTDSEMSRLLRSDASIDYNVFKDLDD